MIISYKIDNLIQFIAWKKEFTANKNLRPSSNSIEVCPRFLAKTTNKLLFREGISPRPLVYSVTKSAGLMKSSPKGRFHHFFSPLHSHQKALPFGNPRREMFPFQNLRRKRQGGWKCLIIFDYLLLIKVFCRLSSVVLSSTYS